MKKLLMSAFLLVNLSQATEIKMLFADDLKSADSVIQPYTDWYLGLDKETTTLSEMYQDGWTLIEAVKLNAVASQAQFWLFFEK